MGYSFTMRGALCCDACGNDGGVRKCACPFGWCPAPALCQKCRTEHRATLQADYHSRKFRCDFHALNARLRDQERAGLLAAGTPVRCSALGKDDGCVHVLFACEPSRRRCVGFYMADTTYHAIPLGVNATPDDYRQFGELIPAPADFYSNQSAA